MIISVDTLCGFAPYSSIFDEKVISQWEHRIRSIKECDAIRAALNCIIQIFSRSGRLKWDFIKGSFGTDLFFLYSI